MNKAIFLLASLTLAASTFAAGTDNTQFKVLLKISESCKFGATAPTDVNFGSQVRSVGTSTNYDAAGKLIVNCSAGTPYTIGLNGGVNSSAAATPAAGDRRMKNTSASPAIYVPYDLYQDSARATFWGNSGSSLKSGSGTGADVAVDVFGRLTNVNFPAGSYEDTVTATITY